jgi:hypothetical protein
MSLRGRRIALVVGVSKYRSKQVQNLGYAENDAKVIADDLTRLGFEVELLLAAEATTSTVQAHIERFARSLSKHDQFVFFFSGHGFGVAGGESQYLQCWDYGPGLTNTALNLTAAIQLFSHASDCPRTMFFLDACNSGLDDITDIKDSLEPLDLIALRQKLSNTRHVAIFSSCRRDEHSYELVSLKHGAWSYHLHQALSGAAPEARRQGTPLVTANSLQEYLREAVPASLRQHRSDLVCQTPLLSLITEGDFLIADLGNVLAEQAEQSSSPMFPKNVVLTGVTHTEVRSLPGFDRQHHRVPKQRNAATISFVSGLQAGKVAKRINEAREGLRKARLYKGKELDTNIDGGTGQLLGPDFEYHVESDLYDDEPDTAMLVETLLNIQSPKVLSDEFGKAIGARFDSLVVEFDQPLDIDETGDVLEELDIECNQDVTDEKTITVPLESGELVLSASELRYVSRKHFKPGALSALAWDDIAKSLPAAARSKILGSSTPDALPEAEPEDD